MIFMAAILAGPHPGFGDAGIDLDGVFTPIALALPSVPMHQSLYRRYRPRRFGDIRGQEHVVRALSGAVESDSVGHAYLFSGPRGTGKTTTARILAKALNCTNRTGAEPCGVCESCVAMDAGRSYDLFELDAASNNGVEAMRDLIAKTAVGSPGKTKVYILDEVHMLSTAASNALLKTLEEPPDHVKFVLATTDPHKVLPTIQSRTQHFNFELLTAEQLDAYVRWVLEQEHRELTDEAIAHVVRSGRGSARDTLSVLEQVLASGGVVGSSADASALVDALAAGDTGSAMAAVDAAVMAGRDPRVLAERTIASLRDAFLVTMGASGDHLPPADRDQVAAWSKQMSPARITRALELLGAAIVDMRQAAEPRIPLEVAVVRSTHPGTDNSIEAILARVEKLEAALSSGGTLAAPAPTPVSVPADAAAGVEDAEPSRRPNNEPPTEDDTGDSPPIRTNDGEESAMPRPGGAGGVSAAREQLASLRGRNAAKPESAPDLTPPAPPPRRPRPAPAATTSTAAAAAASSYGPASDPPAPNATDDIAASGVDTPAVSTTTPDQSPAPSAADGGLAAAYQLVVENRLRGVAKALFNAARVGSADDNHLVLVFANQPTLDRASASVSTVEAEVSGQYGQKVTVELTTEGGSPPDRGRGAPDSPRRPTPLTDRTAAPSPPASAPRPAPDRSPPRSTAGPASVADLPAPPIHEASDRDVEPPRRPSLRVISNSQPEPVDEQTGPSAAGALRAVGDDDSMDDEVQYENLDDLEDAVTPNSLVERVLAVFPDARLISDGEM